MDDALVMDAGNDDVKGKNAGFKQRARRFAESKEVGMLGRLNSDIFHQPLCIPTNTDLKIKLIPSKDAFILKCPAAGNAVNYKMVITAAKLYVHVLQVSKDLLLAHTTMLQKVPMRFPTKRVSLKTFTIPNGSPSFTQDNLYLGAPSTKIILGLVNEAAVNGNSLLNPFNFKNYGLNYLTLFLNGMAIPYESWSPNFATGDYVREYANLFSSNGTLLTKDTENITYDEFGKAYCLFAFDLNWDNDCGACLSPIKTGSIRIEIKFSAVLPNSVNLLCYASYDSMIEIDKFRNVILSNY
jgi:hypothetical protein